MGFDLIVNINENRVIRKFRKCYDARKLSCFGSNDVKYRVYSTKTSENDPTRVLEANKKSSSNPISLASLFELVADDVETLNKNLQNTVGAESPLLMSASEQIFGAGGKRLRPALVFLISRATTRLSGLKELTTEHRRLAEIIEMIHTASLIHDDVIDESDLRKASLLAASTKGAAIFSEVDLTICQAMYEYGKNLGLSFQIVDDILDFIQTEQQLGKPAGADLMKGNLTAPVIYALEREPKLREIIGSEFSETGSLDEAIHLVKSSGGIEKALALTQEKAD